MKPSHRMVCQVIEMRPEAHDFQRELQKWLDDGWTLRAAVPVHNDAAWACASLIFVRKERRP